MDRVAADAFVYAKASGLYAKAFVGARAKALFECSHVSDLWSLLFADAVPLEPESRLAQLLERRIAERAAADFVSLVRMYDKPDPLSLAILSFYDCGNIKTAYQSVVSGAEKPYLVDISPFSRLHDAAWPDIGAMTADSPYSWFDRVPDAGERVSWENRLDRQYYRGLWSALQSLSRRDRTAVEDLIRDEIIFQNILWTLRMRVYYNMTEEEILPMLAGADGPPDMRAALTEPAMAVMDLPLDTLSAWKKWKYFFLLNPETPDGFWELDPRWLDLQCRRKLFHTAMRRFHQTPFTVGALIAFFYTRRLEEYLIRVAAEGIRIGASENQMSEFVEDFDA